MKRLLSLIICITLILTSTSYATTSSVSNWAQPIVKEAQAAGYIPKNLQSNYQKEITKIEFAELLTAAIFSKQLKTTPDYDVKKRVGFDALSKSELLKAVTAKDFSFTDTKDDNVKALYILGYITSASGKFEPNKKILRQDAIAMIAKGSSGGLRYDYLSYTSRLKDNPKLREELKPWIAVALDRGILSYKGDLSEIGSKLEATTTGTLTRETAMMLVHKAYAGSELNVKLRGAMRFERDVRAFNWEVTKSTLKATKKVAQMYDAPFLYKQFANKVGNDYTQLSLAIIMSYLDITPTTVEECVNKLSKSEDLLLDIGWMTFKSTVGSYPLIGIKDFNPHTDVIYGKPIKVIEPVIR